MRDYVIRYAIFAPLLFALIYFEPYSPLIILNELQTDMIALLTRYSIGLFGLPIRMDGVEMVFEHGMRLRIVHECNGMSPFLLYAAAITAYPTRWNGKAAWLVGGYFAISSMDMVRILGISYGAVLDPQSFHWMHSYVGRYGMGLFTLALFALFAQRVEICRNSKSISKKVLSWVNNPKGTI